MYLHEDARLIYLAHPRTASVSTADALMTVGFNKLKPPSDHHMRLFDEGSPVTKEDREDWIVFSTVRNHWDTIVSWAFRRYVACDPLKWDAELIQDLLSSNTWVSKNRLFHLHLDDSDIVLRYESLEEDLDLVLKLSAIKMPIINKLNVSPRRKGRRYQDLLEDSAVNYIGERFKEEIELLNYKY